MADDLTFLLRRLIESVPGTRSTVLLSVDGMPKFSYGIDLDGRDTLAALASGICSLAQQVGARFGTGPGDGVRQVVTELEDTVLFVTSASIGSVIAVLADRAVDVKVLGYELTKLCSQVPHFIATPSRPSGSPAAGTA